MEQFNSFQIISFNVSFNFYLKIDKNSYNFSVPTSTANLFSKLILQFLF